MKKLLFAIILFPLFSLAQVPQKANVVVFESASQVDSELFKTVVYCMKECGYQLKDIDKDFFICATEPIKDQNYECKLSISVTGKNLEIRSFYRMTTDMSFVIGRKSANKSDESWEKASNRGLKTSIYKFAFGKGEEIANKVLLRTAGEIKYKIE